MPASVATVCELWLHPGPHADEALAVEMLQRHGNREFPGVGWAKINYVNPVDIDENDDWEEAGVIPIGILRGWADEHPAPGEEQPEEKKDHCAATLVAKRLGLLLHSCWKRMLEYVRRNDLAGTGTEFDFCFLGKDMGDNSEAAMSFMRQAISAIYFHEVALSQTGQEYNPCEGAWFFDRILAGWLKSEFSDHIWAEAEFVSFVFGPEEVHAQEVAQELGIDEDPALVRLLRFVKAEPCGGNLFDLKGICWLIRQQNLDKPELAIRWALQGIYCKMQAQLAFVGPTQKEYEEKADEQEIRGPYGKNLKVVTIQSDYPQMNKFCRFRGAAVVIQQVSSGNVQIYTANRFQLNLADCVAMIRLEEQKVAGEVLTTDWRALKVEGTVKGAERWYYLKKGEMLLNGSKTIKQPPTALSLKQIQEFVRICLEKSFELARARTCMKGYCCASRREPCPWYGYGLTQCISIRQGRRR